MNEIINPRLKRYLQILHAGPEESKRLIGGIPRELTAYHSGEVKRVRELLTSTSIQGTSLIQTEFYNTVMQGASKAVCFRNAVKSIPMSANSLKVPIRKARAYARHVPEFGEIPITAGDYTTLELTADKIGERPLISQEMIDDSQYAIMEMELLGAGEMVENTINQDGLSAWLAGTTQDQDTTGSNQGRIAVSKAITKIVKAGFIPDTIIMCPEFEGVIRDEIILPTNSNNANILDPTIRTGKVASGILGLDWYLCSVTPDTAVWNHTWGYASDGQYGAIVFDSTRYGYRGVRKDITINQFADPARDMKSATVSARNAYGVATENLLAACTIQY
jgi:hypothetical protein